MSIKLEPKITLCNFIEIALRHECSPVNLLHIFRTPFPKSTSGHILLTVASKYFEFSVFDGPDS